MSATKHERDRAADALTERHVARLRAICDAERAEHPQWFASDSGEVLSHGDSVRPSAQRGQSE